MNFGDILYNLMSFLYENLILPIQTLLMDYTDGFEFSSPITFTNFGSDTTMFVLTLNEISVLIIGFLVSITALVFTWKFLKMLTRFVYRLFGGIRK